MSSDTTRNPQFITMAEAIAGEHWPTRLPAMIGKCRTQVWEYANQKRKVPQAVTFLMQQLEKNTQNNIK